MDKWTVIPSYRDAQNNRNTSSKYGQVDCYSKLQRCSKQQEYLIKVWTSGLLFQVTEMLKTTGIPHQSMDRWTVIPSYRDAQNNRNTSSNYGQVDCYSKLQRCSKQQEYLIKVWTSGLLFQVVLGRVDGNSSYNSMGDNWGDIDLRK